MSVYITRQTINPSATRQNRNAEPRLFARLFRSTLRQWQHRKMIAALQKMDDWILYDIGIERADIPAVVNGFSDRELRMVPLGHDRKSASQGLCHNVV